MQATFRAAAGIGAAVSLAGCAVTQSQFEANPHGIAPEKVCQTWAAAQRQGNDAFASELRAEMDRRMLTEGDCQAMNNKAALQVIGGIILAGAIVAAAAAGGGGGGYHPPAYDTQWDWDLISNNYGVPVWSCRGVQTGQFADEYHCGGLPKVDVRWPGL